MAIKYYPNRIYKKVVPAIDREMAKRDPLSTSGRQDLNLDAINSTVYSGGDWQIDMIGWEFNNATSRNFSANIKNGRRVITTLNDYLWFRLPVTSPQMITLDDGFYTGSQLAVELQTQMDANTAFSSAGVSFTVSYSSSTGLYTIVPSSGTVQYLNVNTAQTLRIRDSIAGHLFGFDADSTAAASISSDTTVYGLDSSSAIVSETASTALQYHHSDIHILSLDQALLLSSNSGVSVVANWTVVYEDVV